MSQARIALDTNVLVRFLVADDAAQARRARALIAGNAVLVTPTVLLETEWVLRSGYGCGTQEIARYLRGFLGLPQVQTVETAGVAEALRGYEAGLDFADALHLALSGEADDFATFDRRLVKRAQRLSLRKMRLV